MLKHPFKRLAGAALALMLVVSGLGVTASAAEAPAFSATELVATHIMLDETEFEYTGEEIRPNVTVRVDGKLLTLDKDYQLRYENNVEVGTGKVIVTGIATSGYMGTAEHPFFIKEAAAQEPEFTLITLKGTDVTIEATEFVYTGQPIQPAVTVQAGGQTLVKDRDYAVEYINNLIPGTGTVIVRGIATASETLGYTGEVRMDFTIRPMTENEYPLIQIKGTDVTIEGTKFSYTGKAIEPKITVTVEGKVLTAGKDYSLRYVNNVEPGIASVFVTGIATATEFGGYTGEVKIDFTIEKAPEENDKTEPTDPSKPSEPSEPSEPAEAPDYRVTQGSGSTWYQGSTTGLSFTVNGKFADFTGVSINGKALDSSHYSVKEGSTVVILKNSYLKGLSGGSYTIGFHYHDGKAEGTFSIAGSQENPKTGDSIGMWVSLMFLSAAGLGGAAFVWGKKHSS